MSLIHRYQSNGYNIVLDINSGCIHLVDLVTYEVLPFMEEGLSEQEIVDKLKDQYPEADIRTSVSECEKLKEQGMWFVCADMGGETMYNLNLTGPIGVVIGNEGEGVSRLIREKCDFVASIPMKGDIDSLNASVAAGVLGYEIVRQRLQKK